MNRARGGLARGACTRLFEELLTELTELYDAHPLAQEEIGYVSMADVPGWSRIGF